MRRIDCKNRKNHADRGLCDVDLMWITGV